MEAKKKLFFKDRKEWRKWLQKNHAMEKEVWLLFYKKHTHKPTLPYSDAVEEALCFGWIDSTLKRIDDEKHVQRFTPRRRNSIWSKSNVKRVNEMIKAGKMTEMGLLKFKQMKEEEKKGKNVRPTEKKYRLPKDLKKLLLKEKVYDNFQSFAPSHRQQYLWWLSDAKKEETKQKRTRQLILEIKANKKSGK